MSGCSEQQAGKLWNQVGRWLGLVPAPLASPSPESDAAQAWAQASKSNGEFLQELYRVVWMEEPSDRAEFGNWVDSLNQGASFEGVYNAFTHSAHYRELEKQNRGASVSALKAFAEELAILTSGLPQPTRFKTSAADPLPLPVEPSMSDVADAGPGAAPVAVAKLEELEKEYAQIFVGASIYTLKRVLGDEALKAIAAKNDYREKQAEWYAKWVVRMAGLGVDFGLPLRNKADEGLHYRWCLAVSTDRMTWEILNRLHRVLNAKNSKP